MKENDNDGRWSGLCCSCDLPRGKCKCCEFVATPPSKEVMSNEPTNTGRPGEFQAPSEVVKPNVPSVGEEVCPACLGKGMVGYYYMSMGEPCDNIEPCKSCNGTGKI